MASYVCWPCRYRPVGGSDYPYGRATTDCPKCGRDMVYVHLRVPRSRDDHKMWALAQEKYEESGRRRRPRRRKRQWHAIKRSNFRGLADWERDLLKAAGGV